MRGEGGAICNCCAGFHTAADGQHLRQLGRDYFRLAVHGTAGGAWNGPRTPRALKTVRTKVAFVTFFLDLITDTIIEVLAVG